MSGIIFTEHGPLVLAEATPDKATFERELRLLDPRLFLELHLLRADGPVWTVQIQVAGDRPPLTVCYWTDDRGRPLPLTWRLLDRVKQLDGGFDRLGERVMKANEEHLARVSRDLREAAADIAGDWAAKARETHSAVIPRSQGLRRARDRRRARGEKC